MSNDVIPYPFRAGGRFPIGVGKNGSMVGVDLEGNILVAGEIGAGCSTVMRAIVVGALEAGLSVTVVDGRAPSHFREGEARHDFDSVGSGRLLQFEDGTAHPATVIQEIIDGTRPRPDVLVIDDAFDLAKLSPAEVADLYGGLGKIGVPVVARIMEARIGTRDLYATRILMGPGSPMARQLALGSSEAPGARRSDPVGTGAVRYSDGTTEVFRGYWIDPLIARD